MKKKTVSAIMLTLLLTSMLTLVFNIQPVKADPAEIIIDTEVGESRFTTYPLRQSPYYWVHVQDHDAFRTRAYGSNFWYTLCGADGTGEPLYYGTWQASLPSSGIYEVFVWIPNPDAFQYDGRTYTPTQSAIYQIYHRDGMAVRTVNQRMRTGGWYSLGSYTFSSSASVILNDRTGEPYLSTMLAFDAIKFVGADVNNPPYEPYNPSPYHHELGVLVTADLSWSGGDPDGDAVTYDVYFGLSSSPPLVSSGQSATTYNLGTLSYITTYYWRITARDSHGAPTPGPLWDFTTGPPPTEYRTLRVYSSPSGVSFTVNGVSHSTPWLETYAKDTPVSLEMPSDYSTADSRYYWYQWSDGVASRSRTVILSSDTTVTGTYVGPYYELTIASSPSSGIPFTLDGAAKATPYSEWLYQGYYTVEMPATYSGQTWQRWMEDGNTDRTRTVSLTHSTTLTAVYSAPPTFLLTVFTLLGGSTNPPSGTYRYEQGSVVTVNAIPESGWEFEYWELDGSNIGATNPLSVTMDRDHNLYANFRILPTPPKILPVPYYSQGDTNWCLPTSMSMILSYYGHTDIHAWDIAKWWNLDPDHALSPSWVEKGMTLDYFNGIDGLSAQEIPASFSDISTSLDENKPVLLKVYFGPLDGAHAVVVVGYEIVGGVLKVFLNDPSGSLVKDMLHLKDSLPFVVVEANWDDVAQYLGIGPPLSFAIAVSGNHIFAGGTIDLSTDGSLVFFSSNYRLSWFGVDKGLVWNYGQSGPSNLPIINPHDKFYVSPLKFFNHLGDEQRYTFEVIFYQYQSTADLWFPVCTLQSSISVDAYSNEIKTGPTKIGPCTLKDLLPSIPGEYAITLGLWNEAHTQVYDTTWLPSFRYSSRLDLSLESPLDPYITDPQGRHLGIDPSTGQMVNEIPGAVYTGPSSEPQLIAIPDPLDGNYIVLLTGRAGGTYSLNAEFLTMQEVTSFNATGIPTASRALHKYCIDWAALSLGGEGVTVQVDPNGDSVFEYTFTSDSELTRDEFLAQTGLPVFYAFSIVWGEETYLVSVESNSTVSNFAFSQPGKAIGFDVTGSADTIGFCNVTIPKALLYAELDDWIVLIDGVPLPPIAVTLTENATHSCLYFTYAHSTHVIQMIGTWVIGPPTPPLPVSISPLSASILVGHSVTFTSTVSGGYTPYSYQWYLNSNPVSGATSNTWTFTPTASGIYYVHLKVTDSEGNTTQSETARIAVAPPAPVGGYSVPLQVQTKAEPVIPYIALIATLTAIFTKLRRKTKRKR
jgi:hypothetical protein